jgi:succinate dehydrogenase/fumarate reductase flavoprotein subunit
VLSIHFPYDCNYFRTEKGLRESLHRLNDLWKEVRTNLAVEDSTYQLLKHMR